VNNFNNKNLLYLASGPFSEAYRNLALNNIYLVDRNAFNSYYSQSPSNNLTRKLMTQRKGLDAGLSNNIYEIGRDAFPAIDILKENKVKIDILVSINEGLSEGGGTYPIFSDILMGYLSPILNDEIILICDLSYYSTEFVKQKKLNWGYNKVAKILPHEADYIPPAMFTTNIQPQNYHQFGNVYRMLRDKNQKILSFKNLPKTKIKIKMGSIWDDAKRLDMIGIRLLNNFSLQDKILRNQGILNFLSSKPKVFNLHNKSIAEIIDYAEQNKLKNIGLCPWMNGKYHDVIDFLQNLKTCSLDSITFYHLNREDYKHLYRI